MVTNIKASDRKISISIKEVEPIDPVEDDIYSVSDAAEEAPAEEAAEAPAEE